MKRTSLGFLALIGLVVSTVISTGAFAASVEKVMGPVVVVERKFEFDLDKLLSRLAPDEDRPQNFSAVVTEFQLNGTEKFLKGTNDFEDVVIADHNVMFYVLMNAYAVSISPDKPGTVITQDSAKQALRHAFRINELDTKRPTVLLQMVR